MNGESYKIWGAGLVALTAMFGIGVIINEVTRPAPQDEIAYAVDVPEDAAQAAARPAEEDTLEPVEPLLAEADAAAGEQIFRRCAACHTVEQGGPNRVGPNLWGVVGNAKGAHEGFAYSDAMRAMGGEWTYEDLNAFLANPRGFMPGTSMAFAGLRSLNDRANIIEYMRQLDDDPAPLP